MNDTRNFKIKWSARPPHFQPIRIDKPMVELTDDDIQHITDTAYSASVFCTDESDVPVIMEHMTATRDALQWQGEITSSPSSYENKKGKIVEGFRVGFNRELSRSIGLLAFNERLAGMAR